MANTFLAARGVDVGKSLCEHDLTGTAEAIFDAADAPAARSICPMTWWWRRNSAPIRRSAPSTSMKSPPTR
jgi:3-phosphoglycerate kinase